MIMIDVGNNIRMAAKNQDSNQSHIEEWHENSKYANMVGENKKGKSVDQNKSILVGFFSDHNCVF